MEPRNPAVAGILSALFPGLGQFYVGRWGKGRAFFLGFLVALGFGVSVLLLIYMKIGNYCGDVGCLPWFIGGYLILILTPLSIWIWGIIDAVRTAKRPQA